MARISLTRRPRETRKLCNSNGVWVVKVTPCVAISLVGLIVLCLIVSGLSWWNTSYPTLGYEFSHCATNRIRRSKRSVASQPSAPSIALVDRDADERSLVQPRAFSSWPRQRPLPCPPQFELQEGGELREGFLYLRPFKAASTTTQSVHLRVARNVASRQTESQPRPPFCQVSAGHGPQPYPAVSMFGSRNRQRSFLWSVIRDPTDRAVSQFFYNKVFRQEKAATAENLVADLSTDTGTNRPKNYYIRSLALTEFRTDVDDPVAFVNAILDDYDFIGTAERLDESLVVFQMLLRLPLADILHVDSKISGNRTGSRKIPPYTLVSHPTGCVYTGGSKTVTRDMRDYLEGRAWNDLIRYEQILYNAVNASLDSTIEALGRRKFEENLARYRKATERVQNECSTRIRLPCDAEGELVEHTDCMLKDMGCGMDCLDRVATEMGLW
jgi:hypothetical protein